MKLKVLFATAFTFIYHITFCQNIANALIFQTQSLKTEDIQKEVRDIFSKKASTRTIHIVKSELLNLETGLHYIQLSRDISDGEMEELRKIKNIEFVSYDRYLEQRSDPNDPNFAKQYAISLSKIDELWKISTGGKTQLGEDIVVVVIDDGVEIDHEDIVDNIFINSGEIPDDNIDNDLNGIKDDYRVFNVDEGNGNTIVKSHGTSVAGIIGAKSDNQKGIAGINWSVKILPIVGVTQLHEIIKAYDHTLRMKRLYRSSNGTKGANIVVTNYSGGIPKVFSDDPSFKPWCDLYNLLGVEGILSIGSAPNDAVDVDIVGDMPSTCTSPYFICVTNIDERGKKIVDSGFGKKSVDIGAPGDKVETTKTLDTYGSFTGTSASAPMVAGVIALLYAMPCSTLATMTKQNPKAASELVRDAVLLGTSNEASLNNITTSNGILNAEKALTKLLEVCNDIILPSPKGNLNITKVEVLSNYIRIEYIAPDDADESLMLSDASGKTIQYHTFSPIIFGQRYFEMPITSEIPHGVYVLTLIHGEELASISLALFR